MELCEAVDNCALTWETGGDGGGWFGQTSVYQSGSDAAQSHDIENYQSAFLQTSIQGPRTVTFYWKVSSEENYDFLQFYVDDVKQDEISGNIDWQQKSFLIESGTHTFKWVYVKDHVISSGSDCGWVDNIIDQNSPVIRLSKNNLHFGASINGPQTPQENVQVINNGVSPLNWQAQTSQSWINVNPASGSDNTVLEISVLPSGLVPGTISGEISIIDASATNSPQKIEVTLNVYSENGDSPPIGFFDTPTSGSTVSGSIPVTGWALDDIGISTIEIKRGPDPDDLPAAIGSDGLVYIGEEVFVKDSRPDVEALYPDTPQNDQSGWGYMMLTYGLPRSGTGTFQLYAIAEDLSGQRTLLGTKQIISDNNNRTQPFGSIDTPGQGAMISGNYVNFGWVLTPLPKKIPTNGSTLDEETGIFSWSIGPGFLKVHTLYFATTDGNYRSQPIEILVNIVPKKYERKNDKNKIYIRKK